MRARTFLWQLSAFVLVPALTSCGGPQGPEADPTESVVGRPAGVLPPDDGKENIELRLSAGSDEQKAEDARARSVPGSKISDAEAKSLLARLPALDEKPGDRKSFALRDASQPLPKTGETIKTPFPPEVTGPPLPATFAKYAPLEVLRFAPDGEVPIAPSLNVTFSKPMVDVTGVDDLAAEKAPVKLSPTPAGKWRWLGTRTLTFDPTVRFPMATKYSVEVPAGTRAADGTALKAAKRWSFETPAPTVVSAYPSGGSHPRRPSFFMAFNQPVTPADVIKHITLTGDGDTYAVVLLTEAEARADQSIGSLVASMTGSEQDGRWVAFRSKDELPAATSFSFGVNKGTPSAEGPLTTKAAQNFEFRTYDALRVTGSSCDERPCEPGSDLYVNFNNPLDMAAFDAATVRVTPSLGEGARMVAQWSNLAISGDTKPRTEYTVTLPAGLRDQYGQVLGRDQKLTFHIGEAQPMLHANGPMVLADPGRKTPGYDVFTINQGKVAVELYRVEPKDYPAFAQYLTEPQRWDGSRSIWKTPPGKRVFEKTVGVENVRDELVETSVDLRPALTKNRGHVIAVVEPTSWAEPNYKPHAFAWVQATSLGLDAFVDGTDLTVWVTNLADGTPRAGVKVTVEPLGLSGTSDAAGLAKFALPKETKTGLRMIVANADGDTAILPEQLYSYGGSGGWTRQEPGEALAWHVFDDRKMYRPGEEVHLKGWVRRVGYGKGGDVAAFAESARGLAFNVNDSRSNAIASGEVKVSATGAFDLAFTLPKTPNLGHANIALRLTGAWKVLAGAEYGHSIQVEEFRRPEYEVTVTPPEGAFFFGDHAVVNAKASYFAGGGLAGAPVNWTVTATRTDFDPPNWDEFVFGKWRPWWEPMPYYRGGFRGGFPGPRGETQSWNFAGTTDGGGQHLVRLDFDRVTPPSPVSVSLNAAVSDVNRQQWAGGGTMLVHSSSEYVGLRAPKMFVGESEPLIADAVVVDLDGKAAVGRKVLVRVTRVGWDFKNGEYVETEEDAQECAIRSKAEPVACEVRPKRGGQHRIKATVADAKGRLSQSELTVWVAGGDLVPSRELTQERVELIPDKQDYAPGETAKVLVRAPFLPAEAIVTLRRSGVLSARRVRLTKAGETIEVPIVDAYTPNVWIQVDAVGAKARTDAAGKPIAGAPKRPAYATGTINLAVPPRHRTLVVEAKPAAETLSPGSKTSIAVTVKDAKGEPVKNAEVALIAVDESVLALTGYAIPDPIPPFYPERGADTTDYRNRAYAVLASADKTLGAKGAGAGGGGSPEKKAMRSRGAMNDMAAEGAPAPTASMAREESLADSSGAPSQGPAGTPAKIQLRTNFNPLALFAPTVMTDGSGRAQATLTLPDNLTRYRVVAVVTDGAKQFGKGESTITARKPLMVRPSAPRFLNFGDRFELPVVLQNQTDKAMKVRVAARGTNLSFTDGQGRLVDVPANDRVEVRLPAAAGEPGTARLQVATASGTASDAAELSLPVWTPATTEAFATYGEIDRGATAQPVRAPANAVPEFGGLEVSTSSTQLQALTDAFIYLQTYPYECAEQISSRMLSVAALKTVLTEFKAEGLPAPAAIEAQMAKDMDRLASLQHSNGAFSFWPGVREWPFVSVHVTHALAQAKAEGYAVPEAMFSRAINHIARIEDFIPEDYGPEARRSIVAYSLYVRMVAGQRDVGKAKSLLAEVPLEKHPMEVIGWTLSVLAGAPEAAKERAQLLRFINGRVAETAGAASITNAWRDGAHLILASENRDDAIVLDAVIRESAKSDVIPKLVRGLLAHQKRGRWTSTQENVFVLLALRNYFKKYEAVTPYFVARAWLGDKYAGEHAFHGRTTETHLIEVPMKSLQAAGKSNLTLQKDGDGRLYYRIGMRYAPANLELAAYDAGFAVERTYEGVDDPKDVERMADGSWKVRAGARVRVRVKMVAESQRAHVALVDPLPAGFEPVNSTLANAAPVPGEEPNGPMPIDDMPMVKRGGGRSGGGRSGDIARWFPGPWWGRWYEHENLRDERAEAFASYLYAGVYEYVYIAKATTPGSFVVPPAKAEEMYAPETFGRSASAKVTITDAK